MADLSDQFWEEEAVALALLLAPVLGRAAIAAIPGALLLLDALTPDPVNVDRESLEVDLSRWSGTAAIIAALYMTRTTRRAISQWRAEAGTGDDLRKLFSSLLGKERAEAASLSEITRSFAHGYLSTFNKSGFVTGYDFITQ
jgi:hypothetical protein